MYKGGRWLGEYEIKIGLDGPKLNKDGICKEMPEQEAKDRVGWEPAYTDKPKKERKERTEQGD